MAKGRIPKKSYADYFAYNPQTPYEIETVQKLRAIMAELYNNPATIYSIEKKLGISHATIYNMMDLLKKEDFIEVVKEDPFRTGLSKKVYGITPKGLKEIIYQDKNFYTMEKMLKVRDQYPDLLEEFGKIEEWKLKETPHFFKALMLWPQEDLELQVAHMIIRILIEKDCKKKHKEMPRLGGLGPNFCLWNDDLAHLSMWWDPINQVDDEWEKEASLFMDNNPWVIDKIREVQAASRFYIKAKSEMEDILTSKLAARGL